MQKETLWHRPNKHTLGCEREGFWLGLASLLPSAVQHVVFSLSPLQVTHVKMASCPPWCAPPCLPSRPHWAWSSSSRFHWIRPRRSASSRDSTRWVSRASRGPIGRPRLRSLWWTGNVSNVLFSICYSSPSSSHLNNIHICRRLHLKL